MKSLRWRRSLLPFYLIACCAILPLNSWLDARLARDSAKSQRLIIVLDGVPYETIAELRAEGRFRRFKDAARMIATFPSSTNPSMVEILQAEPAPGYEDHYYDREQNRLLGNMLDRFNGARFIRRTFREGFDYHAGAAQGGLGYVVAPFSTLLTAQSDWNGLKRAFRRSTAPVFIGYVGASDSLAHLGGEWALKSFLRTLDRGVEELLAEADKSGAKLEVEMFSDHGNRYGDYRHVKLNDALRQAGFVTEKSLKNERSVVLPKYGLVGSAQLFTWPDNKAGVAEACAAAEGVDFALYLQADNSLALASKRGRARLAQAGERFKYEDLGGDVLRLGSIVETLRASGQLDTEGFAAGEAWYQATRNHAYVDPLRRLFAGFNSHVRNRADVIVSFEDGYLIGSPFMSAFAVMRATHGNLLRGETEGFAMSTRQSLGESVRGYEVNKLFALHERSKAAGHFSGEGHCQLGPELARALIDAGK
jgi:hypothetical protein